MVAVCSNCWNFLGRSALQCFESFNYRIIPLKWERHRNLGHRSPEPRSFENLELLLWSALEGWFQQTGRVKHGASQIFRLLSASLQRV